LSVRFQYGTETSFDSRGKPYVTLVFSGVKPEGEAPPRGHINKADAWGGYFAMLNTYLAENDAATVEWRVPPVMEEAVDGTWRVYSRLSVLWTYADTMPAAHTTKD
jgi:hypothetical protein